MEKEKKKLYLDHLPCDKDWFEVLLRLNKQVAVSSFHTGTSVKPKPWINITWKDFRKEPSG